MSTQALTGFEEKPDLGRLKTAKGEYSNLQNIRGWGHRGAKRQGVRTLATLTSGVMGIFDLKLNDTPDSLDKILVVTANGEYVLYEPSELFSFFAFEFQTGIGPDLQSPDLNWWRISPGSSNNWKSTQVAAPATTQSSDFIVRQDQLLGFQNGTTMERLYVEFGKIKRQPYAFREADTVYSTDFGIATGFGMVFTDSNLERFRLTMRNNGIQRITSF